METRHHLLSQNSAKKWTSFLEAQKLSRFSVKFWKIISFFLHIHLLCFWDNFKAYNVYYIFTKFHGKNKMFFISKSSPKMMTSFWNHCQLSVSACDACTIIPSWSQGQGIASRRHRQGQQECVGIGSRRRQAFAFAEQQSLGLLSPWQASRHSLPSCASRESAG